MSDKKYNTTMLALWRQKTGNFMSMRLDDRSMDTLALAFKDIKKGGKIMFKILTEEVRTKFNKKDDKAPHAFIEILSPENVAEFEANRTTKTSEATTSEGL